MLTSNKSNYNIFVVDQITFGILVETSSISVANAICKGILNVSQMTVSIDQEMDSTKNYILVQPKIVEKHGEANTAKIVDRINGYKRFGVEEFTPTVNFLEKREIANYRKYGLELLEKNIARFLSRNQNYIDDASVMSVLSIELAKCSPDSNIFSPAIHEWAIATNSSISSAYNFLKMQHDCYSTSVLRFHALWTKYVNKINHLHSKRDIHICALYEFEHEVYASGEGE